MLTVVAPLAKHVEMVKMLEIVAALGRCLRIAPENAGFPSLEVNGLGAIIEDDLERLPGIRKVHAEAHAVRHGRISSIADRPCLLLVVLDVEDGIQNPRTQLRLTLHLLQVVLIHLLIRPEDLMHARHPADSGVLVISRILDGCIVLLEVTIDVLELDLLECPDAQAVAGLCGNEQVGISALLPLG